MSSPISSATRPTRTRSPPLNPANPFARTFAYFNAHRDDLWIGAMGDIAVYGEERDTATLKTVESGPGRVVLDLTSRMDPAYFDYPLTIKVRLPETWSACRATQAGKPLPATVITHDGARFALVKAVPNAGRVDLAAN